MSISRVSHNNISNNTFTLNDFRAWWWNQHGRYSDRISCPWIGFLRDNNVLHNLKSETSWIIAYQYICRLFSVSTNNCNIVLSSRNLSVSWDRFASKIRSSLCNFIIPNKTVPRLSDWNINLYLPDSKKSTFFQTYLNSAFASAGLF